MNRSGKDSWFVSCRKIDILARNCAFVSLRVVEPSLESQRFGIEMRMKAPSNYRTVTGEEIDEKSGAVQNEIIQ